MTFMKSAPYVHEFSVVTNLHKLSEKGQNKFSVLQNELGKIDGYHYSI